MKHAIDSLQAEWCTLEGCWRKSREGWNDSVAWRFEHEFWEPLSQAASKLFRETESLSERLQRVRARVTR